MKDEQDQVVTAVLSHPQLKDAAESLGINYTTLWRRMQDPELKSKISKARHALLINVMSELESVMGDAAASLRELFSGDPLFITPKDRLAAIRMALEMAFRGWEVSESGEWPRPPELEEVKKEHRLIYLKGTVNCLK